MDATRRTVLTMVTFCTLLMLCYTYVWAATPSSAQEQAQTIFLGRALWVWNTYDLVVNPIKRAEFFEFVMAPKDSQTTPIKRLFLSASWAIQPIASRAEQASLASFLTEAHQIGLTVDLLAGTSSWASTTLAPNLNQLLQNLTKWQRETAAQMAPGEPALARFDGLQLDVEPYTLDTWPSQVLFDGWVSMAQQVYTYITDNPDLELLFGLALPIWLDQEKYQYLNEPLQAASDYIALMDYRDTAPRIVRDALNELLVANRLQRAVFVGINTRRVTGDPPNTTFYEEGNAAMEKELRAAEVDLITHASFVGFAIHHHEAYIELKP